MTRRASCSCGQLSVVCDGEPARISICHCLSCKQRTGSAFGLQARFPFDRVRVEGRASEFVHFGDGGGRITRRFCPTCGSTVYWDLDTIPGFFTVAVGAFADPNFPAPKVSVYGARRHAWMPLPQSIEENLD